MQRVVLDTGGALTGKRKSEAEQLSFQFSMLVKALSCLADENNAADAALTREMFQTAQWALGSEAAQSLAQMAARSAINDPALATLVRERQDQAAEWQKRDLLRNHTLSQTPEKRNAKAAEENLAVDRRQQMTPLQLGSSTRKSVGIEPDPAPQISAITGPNEPNTSRKAGSVLDADWGRIASLRMLLTE